MSDEGRLANFYIYVHPSDCDPPHDLDMTKGGRDWVKVTDLIRAFKDDGFDINEPALVGYPLNGRIQLLSGTHRHRAANAVGMFLPVRILLRSEWEAVWGTDVAAHMCRDIAVKDLIRQPVGPPTPPPALDDRVDLSRDLY